MDLLGKDFKYYKTVRFLYLTLTCSTVQFTIDSSCVSAYARNGVPAKQESIIFPLCSKVYLTTKVLTDEFTLSFNKHFLDTYSASGTILIGVGDPSAADRNPHPHGAYVLEANK